MSDMFVVDNFYKDPEAVRKHALSVTWIEKDNLNDNFPGTESKKCFFSQGVVDRLSRLIDKNIIPDPKKNSFGAFALTFFDDNQKRIVHIDKCDWTGIVYLTPNEHINGGTTLYRHIDTGLNRYPSQNQLLELGFLTTKEFNKNVLLPDGANLDKWEEDVFIEMRFNRLFLFRGSERFHAPNCYFGTNLNDARLVQLFFFNET